MLERKTHIFSHNYNKLERVIQIQKKTIATYVLNGLNEQLYAWHLRSVWDISSSSINCPFTQT